MKEKLNSKNDHYTSVKSYIEEWEKINNELSELLNYQKL